MAALDAACMAAVHSVDVTRIDKCGTEATASIQKRKDQNKNKTKKRFLFLEQGKTTCTFYVPLTSCKRINALFART